MLFFTGAFVTRWYPDQEAEADYHPVRAKSRRHMTVTHSKSSFYNISKTLSRKRHVTRESESLRDTDDYKLDS